jgi:hypothetical protein
MRLVQALTPADKVKRPDFCEEMQLKMEENDSSSAMKPHSISVARWRYTKSVSGDPSNHTHQRDNPKVNVFCAVSREKMHGPYFFIKATVTGESFLYMLENCLLPQLNTNYDDYIPQLLCVSDCTASHPAGRISVYDVPNLTTSLQILVYLADIML